MRILGIWDGHDAGAALVENGKIIVAINEERLSRRKLEVGFPHRAITACLNYAGLKSSDIDTVAACTSDLAKTLTRAFPSMKESYYQTRRRKRIPRFPSFNRNVKYRLTEFGSNTITKTASRWLLKKELAQLGLEKAHLKIVDHHMAHAAGAAYTSGFSKAAVVTLDGLGDGLSGSISTFENGELNRIAAISSRDSLGIFYEHVTNLLNMRELEDEGKVMCMADYSFPIPDEKNPMMSFFRVNGLGIKAKFSSMRLYYELRRILWTNPAEHFAYMAQRTLEQKMAELFTNVLQETGMNSMAWSGGVAANIKANMRIKDLPQLREWYVFPHMGDGGLALGAALHVAAQNGFKGNRLDNAYLGQEFSPEEIESVLKRNKLHFEEKPDVAKHAGELISEGNYILWFQGRSEFGPRALGDRSIVAPADNATVKERLNMRVKKREWFQPFCPSMLVSEAARILDNVKSRDAFMTMGHMVKPTYREQLRGVTSVDGSSRPQMVEDENKKYETLMRTVKRKTGLGVILNTSFNAHGSPIVNTPAEAVAMMLDTKSPCMAIGDFMVELK